MSILPLPVRYKSALLACFLAALCWLVPSTHAVVYLSNLSGSGTTAYEIVGGVRFAVGFQVNSTENNTWDFTIRVVNNVDPSSVVRLQIYNDDAGHPDDVTTPSSPFSISFLSSSGPNTDARFTFRGSGTLTAGNTYWLVATAQTVSDDYFWIDSGAYTETGATFQGAQGNDGVSGWATAGSTVRLSLEIAPVPEPMHYGLFAAMFLVFCSIGKLCWTKRFAVARVRRQSRR